MADWIKGLGYYVPPELRNLGASVKALGNVLRPNPIINNPNVANLLRAPSIAGVGKVLSDAAITAAEVIPGGKIATTPIKKISKLADELITGTRGATKKALEKMDKDLVKSMTDEQLMKHLSDKYGVTPSFPTLSRAKKALNLTGGGTLKTRTINNALEEMGDDLIETMTGVQLRSYLKNNYGITTSRNNIYKIIKERNLITQKAKTVGIADKLTDALKTVKQKEITIPELMQQPAIKKLMDEGLSEANLIGYLSKLKSTNIPVPKIIQRTQLNVMSKLGIEDKAIDFLTKNKNASNAELLQKFPELKNANLDTVNAWRLKNNLGAGRISRIDPDAAKLVQDNPELKKFLEFVPEESKIPIKHKEGFYHVDVRNIDGLPREVKRTKIIQAHGLGKGKITDLSVKDREIIKNKINMIPDKYIEEISNPTFFLTESGNDAHRVLENKLIDSLIKRYRLLGWEHSGNAGDVWKQIKKTNFLSRGKRAKIKSFDNIINKIKGDLEDLDAYTVFYNPLKDTLVSYGKNISEIPGLANLMHQVIKGTKKLKYGGLVGISHLMRPIQNFSS